MRVDDMIKQFNIGKVSKSGAKFDIEKLNFFNSNHIRMKYSEENLQEWRKMLIDHMPENFHGAVTGMNEDKMVKVMEMMKIRMRFVHDIKNHTYLFGEPDYSTDLGQKFLNKIKSSPEVNIKILKDIFEHLKTCDKEFSAELM